MPMTAVFLQLEGRDGEGGCSEPYPEVELLTANSVAKKRREKVGRQRVGLRKKL